MHDYDQGIMSEIKQIKNSAHDEDKVLSSCLAVTSMTVYICKGFWPWNTQIVSYCLMVAYKAKNKGRLLEILTGEGKSCVIAMVAATYALQGRTVDIVTSSPVLSQRDADEWREFYKIMGLDSGSNVNTKEDSQCYKCPIVYGTVETFARDILKTEFLLEDVSQRKDRKCDMVIVDEVDSMLIDQGIQCTYLSHEIGITGMHHFEPILAFIWMHVSLLTPVILKNGVIFHWKNQEVFFISLSRLNNEIDPLEILRMAEDDERSGIVKGFTDKYISHDIEGEKTHLQALGYETLKTFFLFAVDVLNMDIDIYMDSYDIQLTSEENENVRTRISITTNPAGVSSVILPLDMVKDRLFKLITAGIVSEDIETKLDLPYYLRDFCRSQLRYWIDNAFLAMDMKSGREYIVKGNAIYPVDYKSTGVIETNKKWGDGLQQFL